MSEYTYKRDCRTSGSESYTIMKESHTLGRIDLHYTHTVVHGTLCVSETLTQEVVRELIESIDQHIVDSLGVYREEFIVHVFQGQETGVYSDHDFGGNGR